MGHAPVRTKNLWSFVIVQGRTTGEILNFSLIISSMLHNDDLAITVNYDSYPHSITELYSGLKV